MTANLSDAWLRYESIILHSKSGQYVEKLRWETHISQKFGQIPIESVTTDTILRIRKSVESKNLAPQTVYHCLSLVRRVMRYAIDVGMYHGPLPKFIMPRFDNRSVRFLSKGELEMLLMYLKETSTLWHDITLFAVHTGLRASEIFHLKAMSVDVKSSLIHISDTKSAKNRFVPLNKIAKDILCAHIQRGTNKNVFMNGDDEIQYVHRVYRKAVEKCRFNFGVTDRRQRVVFHTLRHTFATWLVQEGVPIATVSQLLGHADVRMTMRYAQFAPDFAEKSVQLLCG